MYPATFATLVAITISPSLASPLPWGGGGNHWSWTGDPQQYTSPAPYVPVVGQSGGVVGDGPTSTPPTVPQSQAPAQPSDTTPQPSDSPGGDSGGGGGGETHKITLVNNCGQGQAVFQDASGKVYSGSTTYNGALTSGVAWISGAYGCGSANAENCGDVEFTLINSGQSSINYSLQQNAGQTHSYKYPMSFSTSDCTLSPSAPGACTGASSCPGAFTGLDSTDGTVYSCTNVQDMELTINFC